MQTTKSNSYSPDYRRRYQTTSNSCECPANRHGKYTCKHIRLERFKASIERRARQAIISSMKSGDDRSAMQIRLAVLRNEYYCQLQYFAEEKRGESRNNADWLKGQVNALERRAAMLRQRPRRKTHWCDHKRTEEKGMRQKKVICLDCKSHIRTYYPMGT